MKHQICTQCVMDSTDPDITFDSSGICSHCRAAQSELARSWFPNDKGREMMARASAEIREFGRNKEYDCIIGVSGGVDSSYLLHVAKVDMGLNPLVVHIDAGWNSEIAVRNIENLVRKLRLDLFTYVVDWEEIRDLQIAFLKSSMANQDTPQDHAFFAKLYALATEKGIKYVLTGGNLTSESILPTAWGYDAMDAVLIKAISKRFGRGKLKSYPTVPYWKYKIYYPYIKRMKVVQPLDWINYDKHRAIEFLKDTYDWRYYGGKHHESKWTKFFQAHYLPQKFGFDKRKAHLSSLIAAGQMTRAEAIIELEKPLYEPGALLEDKIYIAKKLGLTLDEFDLLLARENKTYEAFPNHQWIDSIFQGLKQCALRFSR